jgi:isopentenyl-diphosphate Delta-isomerase
MEHVILVDERDNEIGSMDKMEAHVKGALHRAFSVLLFNSKGEILLQKRSLHKYHSAGLWTNTCCSHPGPTETMEAAVRRRLREEMGIDLQPEYLFKFLYRVELPNNLVEHELDHVYIGLFNGEPMINIEEVENWRYVSITAVKKDMLQNPEAYTYWFRAILHHPKLQVNICLT